MEDPKMILDNTRQIQKILISIKNSQKIIEEANRGINIESLENMKEDMEQINDNYSKEGDNEFKNEETPKDKEIIEENKIKEVKE